MYNAVTSESLRISWRPNHANVIPTEMLPTVKECLRNTHQGYNFTTSVLFMLPPIHLLQRRCLLQTDQSLTTPAIKILLPGNCFQSPRGQLNKARVMTPKLTALLPIVAVSHICIHHKLSYKTIKPFVVEDKWLWSRELLMSCYNKLL